MHIEIMRGTLAQNAAYCSKQGKLYEFGDKPAQGIPKGMSATKEMVEEIKLGKTDKKYLFMKYGTSYMTKYKAVAHCIELVKTEPSYKPKDVQFLWGATRSGKSKGAIALFEEHLKIPYFIKNAGTGLWWDGYEGEDAVIIDEFDYTEISIKILNTWTDVHPCRVQTKGGMKLINPKYIVITSQTHYKDWYPFVDQGSKDAFAARITNEHHYT